MFTRTPIPYLVIFICLFFVGCAPQIEHFSPSYGTPGTEVRITGKRLVRGSDASNTSLSLNGISQTNFVSATSTEIRFIVSDDAETGRFKIQTSGGSNLSENEFDIVANANDPNGAYTFGGIGNIQALKVSPSETNQQVLIGVTRARWANNSGNFATFQPTVDTAFDRMNEFWMEASNGRVSFDKQYLTTSIIDLPKSNDYYYHDNTRRDIRGFDVPANISLPDDKTLTIESDGQDIEVTFTAGTWTPADIVSEVVDALANADLDEPAPTFTFSLNSGAFRILTTRPPEAQSKIELSGNALAFLGFGAESLYGLGSDGPMIIVFSQPLVSDSVEFLADVQLTIQTLGEMTVVDFSAGTFTVDEIVTAIESAYPGDANQQPFEVSSLQDPNNDGQHILVFKTITGDDLGTRLMISGSARTSLGLQDAGVLRRYEPEIFRGSNLVLDAFNIYAESLPAGTDLNSVFGDARMFVGYIVDNNTFRAHHSSRSFDIQGDDFEVNYFAANDQASVGAVFAHETGHALGLPDLYRVKPWQLGTTPGNWDVMDCSFCDAHPVAWLKSRHHRASDDQDGPWIDNARIEHVSPPAAMSSLSKTVILTPTDSPWISSNPFSTTHPGVQVTHALELTPADPRDVFVIENRQTGPYTADHLGDTVDFSQSLPGEGVIMYQGRRELDGIASFLPVNLLTQRNNPLNTVGESFEHIITNSNKINISILEKLTNPDSTSGNPSFSYLTQLTWGEGSFFDLAIREWEPPPWESVDIWVDSQAENAWDTYTYHDADGGPILNGDNVAVGEFNRLYARVHNLGDVDVTADVEVIFSIALPQMVGGDADKTELGRVTISGGVPANSSVVAPAFNWRPTTDNDGHVCIRAEIITQTGELNGTLNNEAQENISQWYIGEGSPFDSVTFEIMTENPFEDRVIQARINVPEVPKGWSVTVEDVQFNLPPSGSKQQKVTINAYADVLTSASEFKRRGYIEEFAANIEAQTPFGDQWVAFGGTTAIVHPVNTDSQIRLDRSGASDGEGVVTLGGKLSSQGLQNPPLSNRDVHLKLQVENEDHIWAQGITNQAGEFTIVVPPEMHARVVKVQAYYGGGRGISPIKSPPRTFKMPGKLAQDPD